MAHLRNAAGNIIGTVTTDGERKERFKREQKLLVKFTRIKYAQEERNKRSNTEQIAALDYRLGTNIGAVRERKRLCKSK